MSHFAQIDENNVVQQVLVIDQAEINTGNWGDPAKWVQTSYNTRGGVWYDPYTGKADPSKASRKNYAGIGFTYDAQRDAFIPPQPFSSWTLNEDTCLWEPPTPMPAPPWPEGVVGYTWDEATLSWVEIRAD